MRYIAIFPLLLTLCIWDFSSSAFAEKKSSPLFGLGNALGLNKKTIDVIGKGAVALKSLMPIKYKEEKAIGGAVALKVFSRFGGPYPDERLARYVSMVGKSVALASDRPDIPYYFAVLNSQEPNAFAAPGGYIFVTVGLIKKLKNEAQLAGVLGHEIAHVAKRHSLQTIERGKRLRGMSELTLTVMDKDPKMFSDLIDNVSELLFTRGLDRSLEFEADRFGTEYSARIGYQPQGLSKFLKSLRKYRSKGGGSVFFQTHPSSQSRIAALDGKVLPAYSDPKQYKKVGKRFKNIMKDTWTKE